MKTGRLSLKQKASYNGWFLNNKLKTKHTKRVVSSKNDQFLGHVVQLPMAEFVAPNGQDFIAVTALLLCWSAANFVALVLLDVNFDQRIEEHNTLVMEKSVKVRIAVRRSLRPYKKKYN
jgi:hypothetical protein